MRFSILCCVSASVMLIPAPGHAAQTPDQILRDQQQQLDMQRQELLKRPDVFIPPPVVEPATPEIKPPADTVCFEIKTIEFDGAPPEWQGWLHRQVASQEGQCLGLADVHALVQSLTNALVERGFVTSRIYLLEQNLKAGLLKFVVVPGRLGEIRLKQGGSDRSLRAAFPLRPGDILNVRDLEQGTEQLARARSQRATMEIVPGSQQGESDVVVTLERGKPWMATLSVDDSGQTSTGKQQGSAAVAIDNVLGINDTLSLLWNQDLIHATHPRSQSNSLSWLLPWGNWTGLASYSESSYRQLIRGNSQTFTSSGHSRNTFFSLSRLLHRNQSSKSELALQLTRKSSRSYIEDAEIQSQRRDLTLLGAELSHRRYLGNWVFDGAVGYQKGVGGWGAMPDSLAVMDGPTARAEIFTGRFSLQAPFRIGQRTLRWATEFRGQYSPDTLMGSEQFSIGSRYTVRGFNAYSLTGQSGYYVRNELALSFPPLAFQQASLEAFAGLDAGQVSGQTGPDLQTRTLSGWAVGLRGNLAAGISAELSFEKALHQPAAWSRPDIVHYRMTFQF